MVLISAAVYGPPSSRKFAGVWRSAPSTGVQWLTYFNTASSFQSVFNAATGIPMRASVIVQSDDGAAILSSFRDDTSVGGWAAFFGLTGATLTQKVAAYSALGYMPYDIRGSGTNTYSVIFQQSLVPSSRTWVVSSSGTAAHGTSILSNIDAKFKTFMQTYGIRAGSLAVAYAGSLKAQRAYTWAEPGYATTTPASFFRLASVSKAFTCAAIKTLANAGQLSLSATVFPLLGITTPLSGMTLTPNILSITVQHLVDHAGGWQSGVAGYFNPEFNLPVIEDAYGISGCPSCPSLTKAQMARYMVRCFCVSIFSIL
jgi:hypothetical protein